MKDFLETLLDKLGEESLVEETETIIPISTGSISLNASIGIGGIPRGRITEIYGSEGSGKTTLCLNTAINCIKKGGKVLYIDVEQMLDYPTVKSMLSVDINKNELIILRPTSAENAVEMAEYGIDSEEFELIIFDSIGALAPEKEKEDKFTDAQMTLVPRIMAKFLRRNADKIRTNRIAFVFINQVRDTIGSFMQTYSTPGGHAVKHFAALIISLTKGANIQQAGKTLGITSKFTIKKNKLAAPFKSYSLPIIFGQGVDYFRDLINFAVDLGIVSKKGSSYNFGEEYLGRGANQVALNLQTEDYKNTLDRIEEEVYNMVNQVILEEKEKEDEEIDE